MIGSSLFTAPLLAFYSKDLYRTAARTWRARSLIFLLALLALCWLPYAVQLHRRWGGFVDGEGAGLVAQIPPITIRQGRLSVDAPQPVTITWPSTGAAFAVIDTTGRVTSLEDSGAMILLTEDRCAVRKGSNETRIYRLSEIQELRFDARTAGRWLSASRSWVAPVLYIFIVGGAFAFRLVQALLLAVLGLGFAKARGIEPGYPALLSVAIIAITPAILIRTFLELSQAALPFSGLLLLCVSVFYLWYGVGANTPAADPGAGPRAGLTPRGALP